MFQKLAAGMFAMSLLGLVVWSTHTSQATYPPELDEHLQEITRDIHPFGSAANFRVRDYLLSQIPEEYAVTTQEFSYYDRDLTSILAFLDNGGEFTRMISVHYDSAENSYGAGDIGTGVAAALTLLPEWVEMDLSDNLLILFVDGEEGLHLEGRSPETPLEYGPGSDDDFLLGSHYFVENYGGEYGEINKVFNFEGRGTGGRLLLFDTVGYSGAEVVAWNRNLSTLTFSLSEALFETQPNVTDVVEYRRLPNARILNFAYVGEGGELPRTNG